MTAPVTVLVVDDSPTMRGLLTAALRRDPEIEVVGSAADPLEAREAIKRLNPDVITLDVEMPNMNGLEFLEKIMRLRPMPVVMVSTLTQSGADTTVAALELGAVDAIGKPMDGTPATIAFAELAAKVKAAARARVRPRGDAATAAPAAPGDYRPNPDLVLAIGASTGGVEALLTILQGFPANCPATVITQHMPASFTRSFAARLDKVCAPTVTEAEDGAPVKPGHIYIAPGGEAHLEVSGGAAPRCRLLRTDTVNGHRPSVDVLFDSVARLNRPMTGVILTGMGKDGAKGLLNMREKGARTLGQDESSSVVYGMPRAAHEIGAVERQLPLQRLRPAILDLCAASPRADTTAA
ncbi:chemotaxis response regulator protein-glutamate methylesterase [Brevundimonas sp. GCM10030266]|uniref:protein-glutamate methylesterase/protein-glutamine glutaminase n=1 Tax=Brevundimonas sp. GCM10030266 TaxID=3273386 RepID=UPI003621F6ED